MGPAPLEREMWKRIGTDTLGDHLKASEKSIVTELRREKQKEKHTYQQYHCTQTPESETFGQELGIATQSFEVSSRERNSLAVWR